MVIKFLKNRKKHILLRIIASLLIACCLAALTTGFLLKRGVRIDTLTMGRVSVAGFSLVWHDKLELQINTITIGEEYKATESAKDFTQISRVIRAAEYFGGLFSRVNVKDITVGVMSAAVNFDRNVDQGSGTFTLVSKDVRLQSRLSLEQGTLVIDITGAASKRFSSHAKGQIRLDAGKELVTGRLSANLGGSLPITLEFTADEKQISFQGKEAGAINTITPFVDLFGLNNNIQRWITDYLKGSRYNLKLFGGVVPWHDPKSILQTLYAEVRVEDCEYTFAAGLEPITSKHTDVTYQKGVLTITPHASVFYGQGGGDSWLDINFNDPANILLTARIKTSAVANDDILTLLNYYKIVLPFRQTGGKTATDLTLAINLNSLKIDANAIFEIDKGVVEYKQKPVNVSNTRVSLKGSNITIESLVVQFEDMLVAGITGTFNTAGGMGHLVITPERFGINIDDTTLTLDETVKKPTIDYHIRPDGHLVDVSGSSWKIGSLSVYLGSFSSPFSPEKLSAVLPPTVLNISQGIATEISGSFSIKEKQADLSCNLLRVKLKDLILESPGVPIAIKYGKELTIRSEKTSQWSLHNVPTTIHPSEYTYEDNIFSVVNSRISYGGFFDSQVTGDFNSLSKQGTFLLENLRVKDKDIGNLLQSSSGVPVEISSVNEKLIIEFPQLDLKISTDKEKNWSVTFNDLANIPLKSTFLQQFLQKGATLTIVSENGQKPYRFSANFPCRYSFLVQDNMLVDQLNITGMITSKGISATVNKDVYLDYTDHLVVTSKGVGYNLPLILKFVTEELKTKPNDLQKQKKFTFSLNAKDSQLFLKEDSKALADQIIVEYADGKTNLKLDHGPGGIALQIEGNQLTLVGEDLNDIFMNSLVPGSKIQKGQMSIAAQGVFSQFSVLIKVTDTIIMEYKPLNNILAFLNTVPALITFSDPEYSNRGLRVNSALAGVVVEDGVATFESLEVKSPVFGMVGTGWLNFPENLINMDLNLITQAKTNIRKIPLLGYIMVGKKERPSITLKVSGDLNDPLVEHSAFREVATMPFNILYRTLTLPFHLVEPMKEKPGEKNGSKKLPAAGGATKNIVKEESKNLQGANVEE